MVRYSRSRFTAATIAGAAVLALTACAGGAAPAPAGSGNPDDVSGTLRVLVPSFPASNEGTEAFEAIVETFQKEYPNVEAEPDALRPDGFRPVLVHVLAS